MIWQRLIDELLLPLAWFVFGMATWAALSLAFMSPVYLLADGLPDEAKVLWCGAAIVLGLFIAGVLFRAPVIRWWKARPHTRLLGKERKGAYRDDA